MKSKLQTTEMKYLLDKKWISKKNGTRNEVVSEKLRMEWRKRYGQNDKRKMRN